VTETKRLEMALSAKESTSTIAEGAPPLRSRNIVRGVDGAIDRWSDLLVLLLDETGKLLGKRERPPVWAEAYNRLITELDWS